MTVGSDHALYTLPTDSDSHACEKQTWGALISAARQYCTLVDDSSWYNTIVQTNSLYRRYGTAVAVARLASYHMIDLATS